MIDIDLLNNGTRHPNLAQMKMSAFCKSEGHDVKLLYKKESLKFLNNYDIVIASKVFNFSIDPPEIINLLDRVDPSLIIGFANVTKEQPLISPKTLSDFEKKTRYHNRSIYWPIKKSTFCKPDKTLLFLGGTGYFEDGGVDLDDAYIEHHYPDYSLYEDYVNEMISDGRKPGYFNDYTECFLGFTTRGCFRKCSFCVNKKFDKCEIHTPLNRIVRVDCNPERKRIMLWDDNFLAYHRWDIVLNQLKELNIPFQFRQGLDLRLMSDKKAKELSKVKYYGDYIFAFDHIQDKDIIIKKLKIWRKYVSKETKLYVLCAYDPFANDIKYPIEGETEDERVLLDIDHTFERISILMDHYCLPYIMRYEKYKTTKYRGIYTQLARWCNQPKIFKKMTFEEFCIRNQKYAKTQRPCSAVRALMLLKQDAPETYAKYANKRYQKMPTKNPSLRKEGSDDI